jgi:predicted ATPase
MINRLYIHNFRCLQNFELVLDGANSTLLIGKNGVGKSAIGDVLEILQRIGRGQTRVGSLIKPEQRTRWSPDNSTQIEVTTELQGHSIMYRLVFELPAGFRELRVLEERLTINGRPKFTREMAEMKFYRDDGELSGSMPIDWHMVGLPLLQARSAKDPANLLRSFLAKIITLNPIPQLIKGDSTLESLHPSKSGDNLAEWWSGLLGEYPAAYGHIETSLRKLMPDLKDVQNPIIGRDAKSLTIRFLSHELAVPLAELSDGEKCMALWALTMAANQAYGPLLCFWDEPSNYLALSEISDMMTAMQRAFRDSGQLIVTSHSAEAIQQFSTENTFVLSRNSHSEHAIIRRLDDLKIPDVVAALRRNELE